MTGQPHFTGDVWNIDDLRLMYSSYATHSRRTERPLFHGLCTRHVNTMEDGQNT